MNNKGKAMSVFLVIIGSLLVVGMFAGLGVWYTQGTALEEAKIVTPVEKKEAGSIAFCSNNPDLDLEVQSKDMLTVGGYYRAGEVYLVDVTDDNEDGVPDTGIITKKDLTSTSTTRTDLTDALLCNHEYELWAKVSQAGTGASGNYSAFREPVMIGREDTLQDPVQIDINVARSTSWLRIRAKDNLLGDYMHDQSHVLTNTTTDFIILSQAGTNDLNFTSTTNSDTNYVLGNGEEYDVTFEVKTNASDLQHGLDAIFGIDHSDDTDTGDWVAEEFKVYHNGVELSIYTPVKNDRTALTGYELFYLIPGGIDEDTSYLRVVGKTDDTETVDRDLVFRIAGTGTFISDANPRVLLQNVAFRDDSSTRSPICTSEIIQWEQNVD